MASTTQNILIIEGNEVISKKMAQHIVHMSESGCTSDCMPCHFAEVWNREMATETFEAFLEHDFQVTDRLVPCGETEIGGVSIPTGSMYVIVSMFYKLVELTPSMRAHFISRSFDMFYKVEIDTDSILSVVDHWQETLPRDENGGLIFNPTMRPHHEGHHLHSLPTTPVSTQFGQSAERASFTVPPPLYSPRRTYRGREIRHPRQINEHHSHLPPFYPANSSPPPPSYDAANSDGPPQPPTYESVSSDIGDPFILPRMPLNGLFRTLEDADVHMTDIDAGPSSVLVSTTTPPPPPPLPSSDQPQTIDLAHEVMVMDLFGSSNASENNSTTQNSSAWMTISIGVTDLDDSTIVAPLFSDDSHATHTNDFDDDANTFIDFSVDLDQDATLLPQQFYGTVDDDTESLFHVEEIDDDPESIFHIEDITESRSVPTSPAPRHLSPNRTFSESQISPNSYLMRLLTNAIPPQPMPGYHLTNPLTVVLRILSQPSSHSRPRFSWNEELALIGIQESLQRIYDVVDISEMTADQIDHLFERVGDLAWFDWDEEDVRLRNFELLRDEIRALEGLGREEGDAGGRSGDDSDDDEEEEERIRNMFNWDR